MKEDLEAQLAHVTELLEFITVFAEPYEPSLY